MPLHYLPDFHPGIANLCKRLRYFLGGIRPRQTTHQILSPYPDSRTKVRTKNILGWYLTVVRPGFAYHYLYFVSCFLNNKQSLGGLPPILNKHILNSISSYSKASRGLFVQLWLTSIFTGLAISPSPSLRQSPSCYAIRAGRNLPDKEFRYLRTLIVRAGVHLRLRSRLCPRSEQTRNFHEY